MPSTQQFYNFTFSFNFCIITNVINLNLFNLCYYLNGECQLTRRPGVVKTLTKDERKVLNLSQPRVTSWWMLCWSSINDALWPANRREVVFFAAVSVCRLQQLSCFGHRKQTIGAIGRRPCPL